MVKGLALFFVEVVFPELPWNLFFMAGFGTIPFVAELFRQQKRVGRGRCTRGTFIDE